MNICNSNKHEDICFDGSTCPLCVAIDEIKDLESVISEKNDVIADLERENNSISNDMSHLQRELDDLIDKQAEESL